MTDEPTSKDTERPADEEHAASEEFAHSDLIPPAAHPTQPTEPSTGTPETTADPDVEVTEDQVDAAGTEGAETSIADEPDSEDETTPADAADAPTEISEETAEKPPRTTSALVPILAATTAVFFVATVLLGLMAFAPRIAPIKSGPAKLAVKAQDEAGFKTIARRFAENFVSIDYKTIDEDLDRMTADATSDFERKLRDTVRQIRKAFTSQKASSSGKALDAAVLSHTNDSAIVQVLLRRTKKNVGTGGPDTGNQVVNVTLVKTDDGWKVSDLSQLGAEAP